MQTNALFTKNTQKHNMNAWKSTSKCIV